jgi:hypothetical protein
MVEEAVQLAKESRAEYDTLKGQGLRGNKLIKPMAEWLYYRHRDFQRQQQGRGQNGGGEEKKDDGGGGGGGDGKGKQGGEGGDTSSSSGGSSSSSSGGSSSESSSSESEGEKGGERPRGGPPDAHESGRHGQRPQRRGTTDAHGYRGPPPGGGGGYGGGGYYTPPPTGFGYGGSFDPYGPAYFPGDYCPGNCGRRIHRTNREYYYGSGYPGGYYPRQEQPRGRH